MSETTAQELLDSENIQNLAAAVIERAFQDLALSAGRYNDLYRLDAYEFLTARLWEEDCLWYEMLSAVLVRGPVTAAAKLKFAQRRVGKK